MYSQQDISIGSISIVGGEPFCPSNSVNFQVEITNLSGSPNDVNGDAFYFQVNGPISRVAAQYTINVAANILAGATQTFIFPTHFAAVGGASMSPLDFSDPSAPYTITASITIPSDPDISNNVSTSLDINVLTPAVPSLSSNDADNSICAGEEITFSITPYSATATYTFKVNNGIIQSLAGVNTITFSSLAGPGSIANGDKVTIEMIDANGCITNSSTQSITVAVSSIPSAGLSASASDGLFCSGDAVNFTATGGASYAWYINGSLQFGATFSTLTRSLSNNDTVTVRVFNASGCYDEESLSFNEMVLDNNGLILLQNASDSNICSGQAPTGLILGDGSGGSLVASSTFGTISYQWQLSTNNGSNYFNINGENAANYQPAGISTTTLYRRNVVISSDTTSCTFIGDDIVTINKRDAFTINLSTNESDNTFCQDQNIIVSANTGAATYTFIVNSTTITSGSSRTINLRSGSVRNLAASPPVIQNGDNVIVQIIDNFGCTNQQTIPIIVDEVGLNPGVSSNAPGNIICLGQNVEIEVTGGVSYTFYINNTGAPALPAEVVGNKFTTNRLNDGDVVISRAYNATGCYIDVNETFTVLSISTTGSITLQNAADVDLCYNSAMASGIDGGNLGVGGGAASTTIASATIAYQWQSSVNSGPWGDIAGATSQSYAPPGNFTLQTRFKRIAFAYYDANGNGIFDEPISCSRTDSNIITVNAKANFDPSLSTGVAGNSYCSGDMITVSAPVGADTYQFFKNDVSLGAASPSRTVTATAGSGGAQFNNGDRIKVQVVADGCTFTNEITILVDFFADLNSASISTNAPSDTICANESVTITAGPPVPGYTYSFTLNGVPAALADVVGRVYTTTAITQQSTVTVVVTNASGCSDTVSLTIFVPKVATAGTVSANADDLVLCPGDNIASDISSTNPGTLDASSSAGSVLTYQWQERNATTGNVWTNLTGATSSALDISATPLSITEDTGIRRLTFATVNTVSCAVNGLPSNVININVEELRSPTITTNPGTTVCAEDVTNLVFTANTSNAQLSDTYQWAINGTDVTIANGYAQNETGATYQVDTLGDITDGAVVTVRTATAAPDSCTETSPGITMSISLVPTANLDSNATAETICDGGSIVITADDAGVGATYAFRLNGVAVPAGEVVGRVYTTTAITQQSTVTVEVASAGGCSAIDTLTIFVPKVATAGTVSANADDLVLCPGDNIASDISSTNPGTLDASSSAGSVLTYQWQERNATTGNVWTNLTGATSSALDISATPLSITEDTGIRRLTFATVNTVSCAVNGLPSNVININVEELRSPTITTNPGTTVCAEDVTNLVFTANTSNAQLSDTYQWAINGTDVTIANGYAQNETGATYQVDTLGDITDGAVVTVRTATAAPDSCTETSPGITMSISLVPTANLDSNATAETICDGGSIVITADDAGVGATYAFRLNGVAVPAGEVVGRVYTTTAITQQSTVTVEVASAGGCSAIDTLTIFVPKVATAGTVSANADDLVLCPGDNIASDISSTNPGTLDASSSAGSVLTYQWQERNATTGNVWTNLTGATSSALDISATPLSITEDTGIRRLTFATVNTVSCAVNGLPSNVININVEELRSPTITTNPGTTVCAEDVTNLVFTANTSNAQLSDTYQWAINGTDVTIANGYAQNETGATYQVDTLGDITDGAVVTVRTATAAPDSCTETSPGITMSISLVPTANLDSNATAETICDGGSIVITADDAGVGATYAFRLNGVAVPAGEVVGRVYTTTAITQQSTVTVEVASAGGCSAIDTLTIFVPKVATAGTVSANADDLVLCPGDNIASDISSTNPGTLDASSSAGSVLTYQWQERNATTGNVWTNLTGATSSALDISATPLSITEDTGIRRLTFATVNTVSCAVNGLPSNVININVEELRSPTITTNPGTTVCAEDVTNLVFTANTSNAQLSDTYQWAINGTDVTIANGYAQNETGATYQVDTLGDITDGAVVTVRTATAAPDSCTETSPGITMSISLVPTANLDSNATAETICDGGSIVITADDAGVGATYAFRLNGVAVPAGEVVGRVYTTTAITQQSTVTVEVASAGGCSAIDTLTIFVPKVATAGTVSANADDLVLCPGDNIASDISSTNPGTLDASSSAGSVLTYQWQERNATTGNVWTNLTGATSSALDISATPLSITEDTGIRRLTFATVNTVSCAVNGLPSNVININVEELRSPTITTNPGTTVCAEDVTNLVFTANTSNAQLSDTYQWAINGTDVTIANGYAQNETGATYQVDTLGDITDGAVVTVRTATAAPDSCTETSPGITMSISLVPTANLDSNATAETICDGGSIVITADDAGVGATYAFRLNGVAVPAGEVVGRVYTTTAITQQSTVTVEVASAGGCSAIDTLTIFVPKVATAGTVSANADDLVLCPGDNIASDISSTNPGTLDASSSAGSVLTYQWQERNATTGNVWTNLTGATSSALDISATPLSITEDTGIRRLTFATVNTVSCAVNGLPSNVININVEELRSPTITTNPGTTVCAEDVTNLVFTANTSNAQLSDTYQWAINGTDVTIANGYAQNETGATYQVDTLGDITDGAVVTVRTATAAPDSCTETSPGITMSISLVPTANLDSNATAETICDGGSIVITADDAGVGATYAFRLNGVAVPAGEVVGRVYTTTAITQQSTVTVEVASAGGCSAIDTLTIFVPKVATAGTVSANADDLVLCPGDNIANDISSTNPGTLDASSSAGSVLTYQWQERNATTGNVWTNLTGATSSALDISATPLSITEDTGIRRLTFATVNTVSCAVNGLPSNVININVEELRSPTITTNPGTTVCAEDVTNLVFTANTSNAQLSDTYQWAINGTDVTIANGYAQNETGATYQVDTLGDITDGAVVTVRTATAAPDSCTETSPGILMSISLGPTANLNSTVSAAGGIICGGLDVFNQPYAATVTFTADVVAGADYRFFNGVIPLTPFQASNVFATDDFSIYDTDLTFDIVVEVRNASGCSATDSVTINLNYVTADTIQIVGGGVSQNICGSTTPTANFESVGAEDAPDGTNDFVDGADYPNGAVISYQWESSIDGGANWSPVLGSTSRTMTPTIVYQTTQYRRRSRSVLNGINIAPCDNYSNIITINVAANTAGGNVQRNINPGLNTWADIDEIICVGGTPQELRVINSVGGAGSQFQWQYSFDNLSWQDITLANGFATDATAAQYQPSAITATNLSSVSSFTITNYANANGVGDIYRVTLSADSFSVTVGEVFDAAAVGSGVSPVDTVDEVLALLEYKINDSGSGITAVDNAATDNIQIILAPGSVLVPTYLISDGGADETGANSANAITYNALGSIRYYRRVMTESFGGAILPVCQTFSDTHSVEVSSVIAGKVSNTNLVICNNTAPTAFNSIRNAYATNIGATLVYQWYRTTDAARTVWAVIPGANLSTLNFGTALTQSTAFKRRVTSTYSATVCFSETDPVTISVLDQVNTAFILADQSICRVAGSPLTVDVNDLANIIANAAEPDDGIGDGIAYQWQFSADNLNWDDITAGSRADLLNGGFAATLSQTTVITAAQIDTDIERRLQTLIDPDIPTIVYYRFRNHQI